MRVLTLKLGDKTYTTGKVTTYLARQVIKLGKDSIVLAKSQSEIKDNESYDQQEEMIDAVTELLDRKTWIVCEAYGNKFTPDDLEKELSSSEIDQEISRIMDAITGTMGKN